MNRTTLMAGFTVVRAIKMWRPLSVTTNLGYYNYILLFLFPIIPG
jgi:hypothetical protein